MSDLLIQDDSGEAPTFVAFDIETSGAYPLNAEIVEIAGVKFQGDKILGEFQSLVRPRKPMSAFIIGIHGITNEMVAEAPTIETVLPQFLDFLGEAVGVAHHAPFDMGFIAAQAEMSGHSLPLRPACCTSLLARDVLPEMPNHKLQTLIQELNLHRGQAHRALDDTRACAELFQAVVRRVMQQTRTQQLPLATLYGKQGGPIPWSRFSIANFAGTPVGGAVVEAIRRQVPLAIVYMSGSMKGKSREVYPQGLVRSLDGDFMVAVDPLDTEAKPKRFYINKIKSASVLIG